MTLTVKQIKRLLDLLTQKTVVAPTLTFPYTITERRGGYSDDPEIEELQVTLSIMLTVALEKIVKEKDGQP